MDCKFPPLSSTSTLYAAHMVLSALFLSSPLPVYLSHSVPSLSLCDSLHFQDMHGVLIDTHVRMSRVTRCVCIGHNLFIVFELYSNLLLKANLNNCSSVHF